MLFGDLDDLPALVRAAARANPMRQNRRGAARAAHHVRRAEFPVGAALVALHLGGTLLRDTHGRLLFRFLRAAWQRNDAGRPPCGLRRAFYTKATSKINVCERPGRLLRLRLRVYLSLIPFSPAQRGSGTCRHQAHTASLRLPPQTWQSPLPSSVQSASMGSASGISSPPQGPRSNSCRIDHLRSASSGGSFPRSRHHPILVLCRGLELRVLLAFTKSIRMTIRDLELEVSRQRRHSAATAAASISPGPRYRDR